MPKFCYGPFTSRRLGLSLGVNVLGEKKRCTFNCVYCEAGRTRGSELVSTDYVVNIKPVGFREELTPILHNMQRELDSVTFGYNGEPTLNPNLPAFLTILREIKKELVLTPGDKSPLATVFTNSTTSLSPEVRHALAQFDLILAKLDVGTQDDLCRINRPHPQVPPIGDIIKGLVLLKRELPEGHKLAIQSLIYASKNPLGNKDSEIDVTAWIDNIINIQPDIVQLYSVARPPAESFVMAVSHEMLEKIKAKLTFQGQKVNRIDIRVY